MFPPKSVKVNGETVGYERFPSDECWTYDPYTLSPIIYIGNRACGSDVHVEVEFDEHMMERQNELYGLSGIFKRCMDLTVEFKYEQGKKDAYLMLPVEYLKVSQTPNRILEYPFDMIACIDEYTINMEKLIVEIDQMELIGDDFKHKLKSQLKIVK